jgi:hypothetical protein
LLKVFANFLDIENAADTDVKALTCDFWFSERGAAMELEYRD